jgi:hypothetical protein
MISQKKVRVSKGKGKRKILKELKGVINIKEG